MLLCGRGEPPPESRPMHRAWLVLLLLLPCACQSSFGPVDAGPSTCFTPQDSGVFAQPADGPGSRLLGSRPDRRLRSRRPWAGPGRAASWWCHPLRLEQPLPVVFALPRRIHLRARTSGRASGSRAPADGGAILVYPNAIQGTWDIGPRSLDGRRVDTLIQRLAAALLHRPGARSPSPASARARSSPSTSAATSRRPSTRWRWWQEPTTGSTPGCCTSAALRALTSTARADEAIPALRGPAGPRTRA